MELVSSEVVIDRIKRRFKPIDSNWEGDGADLVGEAMDSVRIQKAFQTIFKTFNVQNHRVRKPQESRKIELVMYKGEPLYKSISTRSLDPPAETTTEPSVNQDAIMELESLSEQYETLEQLKNNTTDVNEALELQEKQEEVLEEILEYSKVIYDKTSTTPTYEEYYQDVGDYLQTSFSTGEIKVFYKRYYVDDNDFPLIVDHPDYIWAIYYYIVAELIEQGYESKHYKLGDALTMHEDYSDKARNRVNRFGPEEHEAFSRMWVRMKFNPNLGHSSFKGL